MAVIRFVVTLPFRLLALLIALPFKVAFGLAAFSLRALWVTVRTALRSSLISFLCGVGLGWFLSTPTGRQLIDQARDLITGELSGPIDDDQIAAKVRTELASGTRTWHLPQPEVSVLGAVVTLRGEVPHETARTDLVAAASTLRGVGGVVDELTVAEAAEPAEAAGTSGSETEAAEPAEA